MQMRHEFLWLFKTQCTKAKPRKKLSDVAITN